MEKLTHLFEKKTFYKGIKNPDFSAKVLLQTSFINPLPSKRITEITR